MSLFVSGSVEQKYRPNSVTFKKATNFDAPYTNLTLDPKIIFRSLWPYVTNIGTERSYIVKTGGRTEATWPL